MRCPSSAALLLGLAAIGAESAVLRVPVERRLAPRAQPLGLKATAAPLTQAPGAAEAFDAPRAAAEGLRAEETEDIVLENDRAMAYFGDIHVGSPGQTLSVIFDTGSAYLWVPAVTPRKPQDKSPHVLYDPSRSSSFEPTGETFDFYYGQGGVSGIWCRDDVTIGSLKLDNFTLGAATDTSDIRGYREAEFDGILGLGFQSLSEFDSPTPLRALMESGELDETVFAFHLPYRGKGELVLGGVDPEHYAGNFSFVNLSRPSYWAVALDGVKLGTFMSITLTRHAIIDSGTSLLAGPRDEVAAIAAMMGAVRMRGTYSVICGQRVPSLAFRLGDKDYWLSVEDLVIGRMGPFCMLGLSSHSMPFWILGDVFLRKFYVQFDWGRRRIGIALSAAAARAGNRTDILV